MNSHLCLTSCPPPYSSPAPQISEKVVEAQETEKQINVARDAYRGVAARGAMLFFLLQVTNVKRLMGWGCCQGAQLSVDQSTGSVACKDALPTLQILHVQSLGKMHAFYSFSLNAFLVSLWRVPGLVAGGVLLTTTTKPLPYLALRAG